MRKNLGTTTKTLILLLPLVAPPWARADDDGMYFSVGMDHSLPTARVFEITRPGRGKRKGMIDLSTDKVEGDTTLGYQKGRFRGSLSLFVTTQDIDGARFTHIDGLEIPLETLNDSAVLTGSDNFWGYTANLEYDFFEGEKWRLYAGGGLGEVHEELAFHHTAADGTAIPFITERRNPGVYYLSGGGLLRISDREILDIFWRWFHLNGDDILPEGGSGNFDMSFHGYSNHSFGINWRYRFFISR